MKFELNNEDLTTLRTGTLIDRIRVFQRATNWSLKRSEDACEAIMIGGRIKIEEFFTPKHPCPAVGGSGFVKGDFMMFVLVKPEGRRRLWRVKGPGVYWTCDSEAIARELLRRLKAGKAPGWVAHDLRHSSEKK